jgi:radical SAM superfamily enzyme YgiQ (UPF0313 family)
VNILLIYPKFPETFWSFTYALRFIKKKSAYPPLGLLTVAALLPGQWPKRLVDENIDELKDEDLAWADLAFVSAMAVQRKSAAVIIGRCKGMGLKIVAGGPLFTAEPDAFEQVDHLVLGEAELTLPTFVADMESGRPKRTYRATDYPDIRKTPIPFWHLIDMHRYASLNIQYSRGCPFNCDFCNITALFGRKPRTKAPQQVLAELDAIYQAGWRGNIFFVDDNFIGNKSSLKKHLLPALIEWRKDKKELKVPAATVPVDLQRFLAFFRACLRLGILGKERFQYWYLLMWTIVRRPRLLPLAVTLSIYGFHYRKICELYILHGQI